MSGTPHTYMYSILARFQHDYWFDGGATSACLSEESGRVSDESTVLDSH